MTRWVLDDELHVLHLQREPAERPFEALEVGDVAGVAEIANVHVALFDLPVLEVDLLLQIPNLKLQSLQVARGCHAGGPTLPELDARRKRADDSSLAPLGYRLL